MNKNLEILEKQKKQDQLKQEVKNYKKKLPSLLLLIVFTSALILYFFEDYIFSILGTHTLIKASFFLIISCISVILFSFIKIRQKEKETKSIGIELYNLMKLEVKQK
ncbi:hypothetical protein [uncultured Polaribacter sp.]|uniref:hypothetical protein n=1 Tax=uncultured Polaribacter sp. TaxID=174711 RepID=UPI002626EFC0|nr:hypothetical protein [uncultured Polaribacter sp.]